MAQLTEPKMDFDHDLVQQKAPWTSMVSGHITHYTLCATTQRLGKSLIDISCKELQNTVFTVKKKTG